MAPGPYIVSTSPPPLPAGAVEGGEPYLPVYFPGTTDPSSATLVDLPAGVNFTGVDLPVLETRAVRVLGRLINGVTGQPAIGAAISLVPRRGTVATGSSQRGFVAGPGTFEFRQIAPGSYDLVATTPANGRLAAHLPLDIGNADIDNIGLTLQPQFNLTGRVSIDNLQPASANPNMNGIRIELRREPYTPELLVTLPSIAADGTFTLNGLTPGDYQLRVRVAGFEGYVKSARYGAIDALNPPFRIEGPGQLEIAISTNAGSLEATVTDEAAKPFSSATVVLVPDGAHRQRSDLYYVAGSDASGRVHLESIAPGDYQVFAWEDVPADAWQDPDFLRLYADRAKSIVISEGSRLNLEVRVIAAR